MPKRKFLFLQRHTRSLALQPNSSAFAAPHIEVAQICYFERFSRPQCQKNIFMSTYSALGKARDVLGKGQRSEGADGGKNGLHVDC